MVDSRPLQSPVPWTAVGLDDRFWAPRLERVRQRTLPALYQQLLDSGRIDALRLAWRPGMHPVPHHFWDSDIAKWLEASSYSLATHPDAVLESRVEATIALLQSAQQPDGYLNSFVSSVNPGGRWTDLRDGHELYCAGHLIEAGVAHFQATGRRSLLEVVSRYADCIAATFGPSAGQLRGYCGHPEIELALVRLYRATGERRYLELSSYFVDERGREPYYFDIEATRRTRPRASDSYYRRHGLRGKELRRYNQSHAPVREQSEVVGHAVRAMYLYSAMADLACETADPDLLLACQRLWRHLMSTRVYVTGGLGSSENNEGFSRDYDLPNDQAYAESCAAVGLVLWAHRMLQVTGQAQYADMLETTLYNAVAAAISADGDQFFYANPLASDGGAHRQPWFTVACCPPNVARLLCSLGQYVYSTGPAHVAVHLFVQSQAELQIGDQRVRIRQDHDYPWDGSIQLRLEVERPLQFGVWLRVPGWSHGARLRINDEAVDPDDLVQDGYMRVQRTWHSGDRITLDLTMPVDRVYPHPAIAADAGCVALRRGPIVYCFEETDNPAPLHGVALPRNAALATCFDADCLGGITRVQTDALVMSSQDWDSQLYRSAQPTPVDPRPVVAVPYAVWDNRSAGQMRVWIRDAADA
jgi:DUF1680 family protein